MVCWLLHLGRWNQLAGKCVLPRLQGCPVKLTEKMMNLEGRGSLRLGSIFHEHHVLSTRLTYHGQNIWLSTYLPAVEVTSSRAVPTFATAVACKIFWLVVVVVKLGGFITSWIFRTNKFLPYIASLKELGSRPQSWGFSWFFNNISQDLNSLSPNKNICITKW